MGFGGNSTPTVVQKPKVPAENDPSIQAALEKEKLLRQRKAGRASTLLSGDGTGLKTTLGE